MPTAGGRRAISFALARHSQKWIKLTEDFSEGSL
jgi:hypothetical protein